MSSNLPVLLVAYARDRTLLNLVNTCVNSNVRSIYIAFDGAKSDEQKVHQKRTIAQLEDLLNRAEIDYKILLRDINLGAGAGVIAAIDWFFTHEKCGIILEDDLEISGNFIRFINKSICYLNTNSKFLMVSGTNLTDSNINSLTTTNYPSVWGWGTSRSKWAICRNLILNPSVNLDRINERSKKLFWKIGRDRALNGHVEAWDIPLAAGMYSQGYLCLLPPVNLVTNVGFDSTATHTNHKIWPLGATRSESEVASVQLELSNELREANNAFFEERIYKINNKMFIRNLLSTIHRNMKFWSHPNPKHLENLVEKSENFR
jgi:hypothetical protein